MMMEHATSHIITSIFRVWNFKTRRKGVSGLVFSYHGIFKFQNIHKRCDWTSISLPPKKNIQPCWLVIVVVIKNIKVSKNTKEKIKTKDLYPSERHHSGELVDSSHHFGELNYRFRLSERPVTKSIVDFVANIMWPKSTIKLKMVTPLSLYIK